jgi:NAD-dependent deacetylase
VLLVTQNIDNLHERAGSKSLRHIHGEMLKARCEACGNISEWTEDIEITLACLACGSLGGMRPHVVWFGEMPFHLDEVFAALAACDLFISIGTSGNVYPAAGFVAEASANGAHTVELNLEPSGGRSHFAECHYGQAGTVVPDYVEHLLRQGLS